MNKYIWCTFYMQIKGWKLNDYFQLILSLDFSEEIGGPCFFMMFGSLDLCRLWVTKELLLERKAQSNGVRSFLILSNFVFLCPTPTP